MVQIKERREELKLTHEERFAHDDLEAGIYTWSLADDRLYGDAVGRFFRNPAGNPSLYSGIVYPVKKLH